ncbi:MAG: hypothetical protein LBR66_04670 [Candidatus Symbiothrix sp.]|nr:hypothetical protein [Candidatus Symbiothrix sp.]
MSNLARAMEIAVAAHRGQRDKSGAHYINHPLRVMKRGRTETERICGVLHDLVEDSDWTFERLEAEGFAPEIIDVLRCVTKLSEDEDYDRFIERVAANPVATQVKINDLLDNMDITRLRELSETGFYRLRKYLKAYRRLIAAKIQNEKLPRHYYKVDGKFVVQDPYIGLCEWNSDKQAWQDGPGLSKLYGQADPISQQEIEIHYTKALELLDNDVLDYLAREKVNQK